MKERLLAEKPLLKVGKYFISNVYFERGFAGDNGPCKCTSQCCEGGVWADLDEYTAIMKRKQLIQHHMDETQVHDESTWWYDQEIEEDNDFPSGRCIGTAVINDKCAFLDNFGRCSIQLAGVAAGEHKWAWKPMYCVLFPVVIEDSVVEFDDMLQGDEACCSITADFGTPLFMACKDELTYLLGGDGYKKLEEHYEALRTSRRHVNI